ncbi:MAG: hypothetical protein ED557_10975 [Balneola sp.]|nr:MAG: hypothetical protein ED557_10975 [Balneola sp.]
MLGQVNSIKLYLSTVSFEYIAHRFYLLVVAGFLLIPASAIGQNSQNFPPPQQPPVVEAVQANGSINVDGKLLEPDWERAPAVTDFFRMEPRQGGLVKYKTSVKVLFDDKNIYFGVFAEDSIGLKGVRVQDLRRDFSWPNNDIFGIQIDAQNLKQYSVSFQTTPYASQRDLQNFNDTNTDNDWDALWSVRTHRTESGYYAEFAIPFKSIRYELPENSEEVTWGITFYRLARRDYEQTVFPAIPQSYSPYRMTYAAELKGLKVPKPSSNIRIEPYVLNQLESLDTGGGADTDNSPKLGGDIKWAITPRSVLDVTFNTDFAQAEVDRAVNNLERFNIFFPERRQFFLENSGIWAGANNRSIVPFFSRRIGLQGTFNAEPARINAGTRYTFRDEERSVAGLYIHQAETDNSAASSFAVGRYLQNYGRENNIGAMVTYRFNESFADTVSSNSNTTVTVDGLIRPTNNWTVSYLLSGSNDEASNTDGLAGRLSATYNANDWYMFWNTNLVSEDYTPGMGFVFQNNVIHHSTGGYYIWRPKKLPWIRRWDPGVFVDYFHDANDPGQFQQASLWIFPVWVYLTDGTFIAYSILPTWQNINFNFAPLGVPIQQDDYYYTRHRINYNSDQSAKLSFSGRLEWGDFYNGTRTSIRGGIRFAPLVYTALTADYEYNDLRNLGSSNEDLDTHLTSVGARFALNPRVQLSSFYQYNTFDEQGRWNVRLSWEYMPLSFVYLVFNDRRIESLNTPFEEQQFIAKITLLRQF